MTLNWIGELYRHAIEVSTKANHGTHLKPIAGLSVVPKKRSFRSASSSVRSAGGRKPENQAADSERKTRWKRGPVNWTPTSLSPRDSASATWTTRP